MNVPRWLVIVMGQEEQAPHAALVIEPVTPDMWQQLRKRMRATGFNRITPHHWNTLTWPYSATSALDIVDGDLIRLTTGMSSIYTGDARSPRFELTPRWLAAARSRRVLVGLVPPDTLAGENDEQRQRSLRHAVDVGALTGGTARARFDLPVTRPTR